MWIISVNVGAGSMGEAMEPRLVLGNFDDAESAEAVADAFYRYCAARSKVFEDHMLCTVNEITDLTSDAKADMVANGQETYSIDFAAEAERVFGKEFEVKFDIDFDSVL